MATERELKLAAGPAFHLPPLDDLAGELTAAPIEEGRYETVYFDTPDLRLSRWGASLRHRSREGWTLKLAPEHADGMLARSELEFMGPATRPPAQALEPVRAYVRHETLSPVARLSTWRRRLRLSDPAGPVVEVVDDEVSVLDGRRVAGRFREVEIELKDERGAQYLRPLLDRLREAGAVPSDPVPKHVRALGPRATEPPEVFAEDLGPDSTAAEAVRAALARTVARIFKQDPNVRLGSDPEAIHQMRVATRTLRSHLRTFRPLLGESPELDRLSAETKWLADALGEVRDLEVLEDRLRSEAHALPEEDVALGERIAGLLEAEIKAARKRLVEALDSERYLDLLDGLVALATRPPLVGDPERPATEVVTQLVRKPWRKLKRAVSDLPPAAEAPEDDLHRVRILAKRARYAAEAAAPVAGRPAERFAKAVASLQTLLGEHQDSVVAARFLRSVMGGARRAFVAGELAAMEAHAQTAVRSGFNETWKAARQRSLREWLKQ